MLFIEKNWLLILVMVTSGAMLLWPLIQRRISPMKDAGTLDVTQLINRQNAVVVDVREPNEYEGGRLPNALHIPLSQLSARGAELGKMTTRPIIAYCSRGQRSRMAGSTLTKLGFSDIYHLTGGIRAWKDAGLPLEKT